MRGHSSIRYHIINPTPLLISLFDQINPIFLFPNMTDNSNGFNTFTFKLVDSLIDMFFISAGHDYLAALFT